MAVSVSVRVLCVRIRKQIGEEAGCLRKQGGGIEIFSARKVLLDLFDPQASKLIVKSSLKFPALAKTVSASLMGGC